MARIFTTVVPVSSAADRSSPKRPHSRRRTIAISTGILLALTSAGAGAARYIANEAGLSPKTHSGKPQDRAQLQVADAGDPWTESLRSGAYWRNQPTESGQPGSRKRRHEKREAARSRSPAGMRVENRAASSVSYSVSSVSARGSTTYRTLCVRLCDGYFWPISFATTETHFERDANTCRASCNAPAALYFYPNPGGQPEDMVDLAGRPYAALSKAFLYRTRYDAACKCRPHPWEPDAAARHAESKNSAPSDDGAAKIEQQ
jgi:hypothetical protein